MQIKKALPILVGLVALGCGVARAAEGALRVGAARIEQTGPMGLVQRGVYDHEHVYARAIVLDNGAARAALISYEGPEADFDMALTRKAIATELRCPLDNILISHTHTHSSALALPLPAGFAGSPPPATNVSQSLMDAVKHAKAALAPARVGFGTGKLYLNANRDAIDPDTRKWAQESNLDAVSDKTVSVLTFLKPSGEPIAVYVNYAMHPIDGYVLGFVSGDFPGAMSRYVEKAFGGDVVVAFSQGPSGDQNPLYLRPSTNAMASRNGTPITGFDMNRERSEGPLRVASEGGPAAAQPDPKVLDNLFRFIESEGQIFGEEVIRVMTLTRHMTSDPRIAGSQKLVSCPGRSRTNGDPLDPKTREGMQATYVDAPPVDIHVGMLGIGTVAMTSVNGEIYTQIGNEAKDLAPMKDTVIVTLANERVPGYIPDDASYGHQTFQVLLSALKPGCAEAGITNAVVDLETQYLNGR